MKQGEISPCFLRIAGDWCNERFVKSYAKNEIILVYSLYLCYDKAQRCSILVRNTDFQVGPKNPMKGTSMKSLVSAFYAQFRVDAGG